MMDIITQIILCLIAASLLGFIIGWIFSSFIKNEKNQSQILAVKEKFDEQNAQINQLQTEKDAKDREIFTIKEQYGAMQQEVLSSQIDNDNDYILRSKIDDIESENLVLLEQIKEQKICEDEKEIIEVELTELKKENQTLIDKIEELKEFEISYKDNIHRIAELESRQNRENIEFEEELKKRKVEKPKKEKKYNTLNNEICNKKDIITDKNLTSNGIKYDKVSDIIKNLFSSKDSD